MRLAAALASLFAAFTCAETACSRHQVLTWIALHLCNCRQPTVMSHVCWPSSVTAGKSKGVTCLQSHRDSLASRSGADASACFASWPSTASNLLWPSSQVEHDRHLTAAKALVFWGRCNHCHNIVLCSFACSAWNQAGVALPLRFPEGTVLDGHILLRAQQGNALRIPTLHLSHRLHACKVFSSFSSDQNCQILQPCAMHRDMLRT